MIYRQDSHVQYKTGKDIEFHGFICLIFPNSISAAHTVQTSETRPVVCPNSKRQTMQNIANIIVQFLQDTTNYAHHANATFFFDLAAFDPADANVLTESSSSPPIFLFLFFLNESFASSNFDFFSCSFFSASSLRDSLISSICLALIIFDSISPFFSA